MPFFNLEGEREATTQNSEEYGKKIIEYLNLHGYYLEHDSNVEGCFQDKIFRNRKLDGNKKTVVEVKDTKLSLSDNSFLREYGNYFKINLKEEFNLFIFAKNVASADKWKRIFDLSKQKDENLKDFFSKISEEFIDSSLDYELFTKFVNSTKVFRVTYDKLYQKIEQIKRDNVFDSGAEYLVEDENLVYKNEKIDSNIFQVTKFPEKLYSVKLKTNNRFNSFWNLSTADKYVQFKGKLYSTRVISDDVLNNYCDDSTYEEINFLPSSFDGEEKTRFIQMIIRSYIICKGFDVGCYYDRKKKILYFPHKKHYIERQKREVEGMKTRYVSRIFYSKGTKNLNFVFHRALKFEVISILDNYFATFDVFKLFSTDGKTVMLGEKAKKLSYKFAPTKAYNNEEKNKLFFLVKAIGLLKYDLFHRNNFSFKQLTFSMPCKAEFGEIFDENFDYEENIYPTLRDYFEGDVND